MKLGEARDVARELLKENRSVSVRHYGRAIDRVPEDTNWLVEVEVYGRFSLSHIQDLLDTHKEYEVSASALPGYKTSFTVQSRSE